MEYDYFTKNKEPQRTVLTVEPKKMKDPPWSPKFSPPRPSQVITKSFTHQQCEISSLYHLWWWRTKDWKNTSDQCYLYFFHWSVYSYIFYFFQLHFLRPKFPSAFGWSHMKIKSKCRNEADLQSFIYRALSHSMKKRELSTKLISIFSQNFLFDQNKLQMEGVW